MKMPHSYSKGERWEPVRLYDKKTGEWIRWPKYYVSNWGRVSRNVTYKSKLGHDSQRKLRLVKPWLNTSGWVIGLWNRKARKMALVRNLVADAFQVRDSHADKVIHRDGDIKNCRVDNLRLDWMRNNRSLSPTQEKYCREHASNPDAFKECATRFLVSTVTVWRAIDKDNKDGDV